MIVVVGSRHDPVATELVQAWRPAKLCSAEDLTSAGWVWPIPSDGAAPTWVIDGEPQADDAVTGVFVRRSAVYPEELRGTHPDDRGYLAAETHALLLFVLATTKARVVNPVGDGALGDEAVRPETWMVAAGVLGVPVAPVRLASRPCRRRSLRVSTVQVVSDEGFGGAPLRSRDRAVAVAQRLGLSWATFMFDGRQRLLAVSTAMRPEPRATRALHRLLAGGPP